MSRKNELIIGMLALALGTIGCGDDDDVGLDAALPDAGEDARVEDAAMDARIMDAEVDARVTDAEVDALVDAAMDAAPDAGADVFPVALTTEDEVPVCEDAGDEAAGTATVAVAADDSAIEVMDLEFAGLSGPVTGAHIHSGGPGEAGPIVLDFAPDLTSPINATFTADDYPSPPPEEAPEDFDSFVEAMREGETYINVHTEDCPPGEIRGQIE